jgi:hypothetical protein
MTIDEHLKLNPNLRTFIDQIVADKRFLALKDAFVSHTPPGDKNVQTSIEVSHGMYLGTRFVFNDMERIYREPKVDPNKKEQKKKTEVDPDLET